MAYDEPTADRIRSLLKGRAGISERKMFGGLAFMLNGNMFCGVLKNDLVLRLGKDGAAAALKKPHTRAMDFTGMSIPSMIYLSPKGCKTDAALRAWVASSLAFAEALPAKTKSKK